MKKQYVLLSVVTFLLSMTLFYSCTPDKEMPSQFDGLTIADQIVGSEKADHKITLSSQLVGVTATCTDELTRQVANWITVSANGTTLTLSVQENVLSYDRSAMVVIEEPRETDNPQMLRFRVTQKHNALLDGFNIDSVLTFAHVAKDSVLEMIIDLNKARFEALDYQTKTNVSWCRVSTSGKRLTIHTDELKNAQDRRAIVTIYSSEAAKQSLEDNVQKRTFLVHQKHNPVLDNLVIEQVTLSYDGKRRVIHTKRDLNGIRALVTEINSQKKVSWPKVTINGDSIEVSAEKLTATDDRLARVTLYLPNKGNDVIDTTTISTSFVVKQIHNDAIDGKVIKDVYLEHDGMARTINMHSNLSDFRFKKIDEATGAEANWLITQITADTIITISASPFNDKGYRSATVTLYQPAAAGSDTVKVNFRVIQKHNEVLDGLTLSDVTLNCDETELTIPVGRELTGVKTRIDNEESQSGNWLQASIDGDMVKLKSSVNNGLTGRKATVTLYYPNKGSEIKENTLHTKFQVTQLKKSQIKVDKSRLNIDYHAQTQTIIVDCNENFTISMPDGGWVSQKTHSVAGNTHTITLAISENATEETRRGWITLAINDDMTTNVEITQATNPAIEIDKQTNFTFDKNGGEINLPITTLTPYSIKSDADWVSIGGKTRHDVGLYSHSINVKPYGGEGFERTATVTISNQTVTKTITIKQYRYFYLSNKTLNMVVGDYVMLDYEKSPEVSNNITWTSSNSAVAEVDVRGMVHALTKGRTTVKASLGQLGDVDDYYDECVVNVMAMTEMLTVGRGYGTYQSDASTGYVDFDCPATITNKYSKSIRLISVVLTGDGDEYNCLQSTLPTVNSGETVNVSFTAKGALLSVKSPQLKVVFSVNGVQYTGFYPF